ncbi:MAG: hypothetical protein ACPH19_05950, partial [Flavobacteriaceae bacterium]
LSTLELLKNCLSFFSFDRSQGYPIKRLNSKEALGREDKFAFLIKKKMAAFYEIFVQLKF